MSLPNMSRTVKRFSIPAKLYKLTTTIVNHKPYKTAIEIPIKVVVQPAQKEKINQGKINWSLKYVQVHSLDEIRLNDILDYKNCKYQAIENSDYSEYGYYESIMEEHKTSDVSVVYNMETSEFTICEPLDEDFIDIITNNVIQLINSDNVNGLVDMNIETWTIIK